MTADVIKQIEAAGVVPIISIENVDDVLKLADVLVEGGLNIIEITFRTGTARSAIELLANKRPEMLLGAGTIINTDDLKSAADAGAQFAVAPGLNPKVVEESLKIDLPFAPGVMTPSDIEIGLSYGLKILKFFPAEAAGGVPYLKSIAAPYLHTGVRFIATGGVNSKNLAEYLSLPMVVACGGSWIAKKQTIAAGNWELIRDTASEAVKIVRETLGND